DGQLGYWVYKRPQSLLAGLAPFVELHYGNNVQNSDVINVGNFTIGQLQSHMSQLNLAAGLIAQIGARSTLSVGAVAPLLNQDNRTFDYQLGVRANIFFGPT